jgi:hypothetical protein
LLSGLGRDQLMSFMSSGLFSFSETVARQSGYSVRPSRILDRQHESVSSINVSYSRLLELTLLPTATGESAALTCV